NPWPSHCERDALPTELYPPVTYEKRARIWPQKFVLVRLFYPAHSPEQMRTRQKSAFQKVGECLYRYSSNGVYYARFESSGKEIRRSLRTTHRSCISTTRARLAETGAGASRSNARQAHAG